MGELLDFAVPEGLRERGTVVVVPGRGETPATYRRFGARIAADAYPVTILAWPASSDPSRLGELGDQLADVVGRRGADLPRPLVLVGVDDSAAAVAALVATSAPTPAWWPDAVILAAPPGYGQHDLGTDWESELDARTHCPVHRGVLSGDPALARGALGDAISRDLLDLAYGSSSAVPHLVLVGDSDPIADRDALRRLAKGLPVARLTIIRGAHHDVLNDLQHRSVAAEVITFLEILRSGRPLQPILSPEESTW